MVILSVLAQKCLEARGLSYSPYSKFSVGAALLAKSGKIYLGCNIENAAFSPTNCAERTAFFSAVSAGEREFEAIAICGGRHDADKLDFCAPCGVCRQVIREFCGEDFIIILVKSPDEYKIFKLEDLLPESFGPDQLK